jgi:hypothetical protein
MEAYLRGHTAMDAKTNILTQQAEILDELVLWEEKAKALYVRYAELFPTDNDFWVGLSREEDAHAKMLKSLKTLLNQGTVLWNIGKFKKEHIHAEVEMIETALTESAKARVSAKDAIEWATRIEKSFVDSKFYEVVKSESKEFQKVAEVLTKGTKIHVKRLQDKISSSAVGADRPKP